MTDAVPRALVRAQVALEAFRLLPVGSGVVYLLDTSAARTTSRTWMRPLRRPARQLTRGRVRDVGPAISPDGRHVAFLGPRSARMAPSGRPGFCRSMAASRGS